MTNSEYHHPIALQETFFLRSTVVAVPEHVPDPEAKPAVPENNIHVSALEDRPGFYYASMRTVLNQEMDKNLPYFIDMECMALLSADNSLTPEEALRGVTITAHSVLYGAIREAVAWTTARQPYGPFLLGLSVLRPQKKNDPTDQK
jgi:hypothetical protein